MRYSRGGIIAVLVAAEIFIAGAILWSLRCPAIGQAGGLHRMDQAGRTFGPIDAGNSPHVVVDDPESGVTITASNDSKVHVTDSSRINGWVWGKVTRHPLNVSRTADGVSITRPAAEPGGFNFAVIGFDSEQVQVAVPPESVLDIRRCSGADVAGLTGAVRVHSVDGHITAENLRATELALSSEDGSLRLTDVVAPSIDASTKDGAIRAKGLQIGGGTLHTDDGPIRLELRDANLTIHARTSDGSLRFNGESMQTSEDASAGDFHVGSGDGSLEVSTQDGSIHISTNGAQQS